MIQLVEQYGYVAVLAIVGLESLGIPLPGETTLVATAIYAGSTHRLNIVGVILAAIAGAILGDNAGYGLGHWGGYRLLVRFGRYIRLHQGRVKVARYLFQRHGGKVVFFGRFISILRAYAAFLAGTTRMPWPRFLFFNATGGIVWASIYGGAAYLFGNRIQALDRPLAIAFGAAAAVAIVAAIMLVRREEHRLEAEAERALPGPLEGYPGGRPL